MFLSLNDRVQEKIGGFEGIECSAVVEALEKSNRKSMAIKYLIY